MKIMKIEKVFNTLDELNNSEEFKALWSGFCMEDDRAGSPAQKGERRRWRW